MIQKIQITIALVFFTLLIGGQQLNAQAPDTLQYTANNKCFKSIWITTPTPLPSEIVFESQIYFLCDGLGDSEDPANYAKPQPNGNVNCSACNSNGSDFTGIIEIDGEDYTYENGLLVETGGSSGGVPLPIELTTFKATIWKGDVKLEWTTAQEIGNRGFEVEKSSDGISWTDLNWIDGAGHSNDVNSYSTTDYSPNAGINYYRLRQIDFDGNTDYSPIVSVKLSDEVSGFEIYPNPAMDELNIKNIDGQRIAIVNISGMIMFEQNVDSNSSIDISQLPAGVYFARNVSSGIAQKFIKL